MIPETFERKKVCVFVRAYNASKYIGECLDSIINQNYPYEIYIKILYDKGSEDNTLETLERYVENLSNRENRFIEIIQHEHCSPFRSLLNYGIVKFYDKYDYFSILDYDNLYNDQYISKAVETLKLSKSDFLYSNPVVIVGDLSHIKGKLIESALFNIKSRSRLKNIILRGNFIDGNTIFTTKEGCNLIRSKLIELSSPTYDWIFEDYSIGILGLYYLNFTKLEGDFVYYRVHESNITYGNKELKKNISNFNRSILTMSSFLVLLKDKMNVAQKLYYSLFFSLAVFKYSLKLIHLGKIGNGK